MNKTKKSGYKGRKSNAKNMHNKTSHMKNKMNKKSMRKLSNKINTRKQSVRGKMMSRRRQRGGKQGDETLVLVKDTGNGYETSVLLRVNDGNDEQNEAKKTLLEDIKTKVKDLHPSQPETNASTFEPTNQLNELTGGTTSL